jgi:hypothetical protein
MIISDGDELAAVTADQPLRCNALDDHSVCGRPAAVALNRQAAVEPMAKQRVVVEDVYHARDQSSGYVRPASRSVCHRSLGATFEASLRQV